MKISIIIATYNRGHELMRTLASLLSQSLPAQEWEAVVTDNNCTDDTQALFARFCEEHPGYNLRLLTESRQGLSPARNRAIGASRGACIAVIDDDEVVNADFARAYVEFFDSHPEVEVCGGKIVPRYECPVPAWLSPYAERPIAGPLDMGDTPRPFRGGRYPGGGNMAVRRSALERAGLFNPELGRTGSNPTGGEEKDLVRRITASSTPAWYVPGAVIWHLIPPAKLTADYFDRLTLGVGRSERVRSKSEGSYGRRLAAELVKWGGTLVLAAGYWLRGQTPKGAALIRMRRRITAGLLGR